MEIEFFEPPSRPFPLDVRNLVSSTLIEVLSQIQDEKLLDKNLLNALRKKDDRFEGLEVPIFKDSRFRMKREYTVDIYHREKLIAIEIEKTEVKNIWKDLVKLSIANKKGLVKYGIINCPKYYRGKKPTAAWDKKYHTTPFYEAINIYNFMKSLFYGRLLIIGYYSRGRVPTEILASYS